MSTTTATLNINATQATQTLTRVQKQVDSLGSAFNKLGNIIGGLAIGSMITNLLRSADAMADLSAATGISIAAINGLSSAFLVNGADADTAQTAILKFNDSVTEAAQGSDKTIETFARLGVSLQDIATLSEQDLLRKTIKGLGEMGPGALRTATAMDLFGKAARTVDFTGVNNQLDQFIEKSKEAEPGVTRAAQLFDNLQAIGKDFGTELSKEFEGAITALKELSSNTKEIAKTLAQLVKVVTAFGVAWLILARVLPMINTLTGLIRTLGMGMGVLSGLLLPLVNNMKSLVIQFVAIFKNILPAIRNLTIFGTLIANTRGGIIALINVIANLLRVFGRLSAIALIVYGVAKAIDIFATKVLGLGSPLEWLGDKMNWLLEKFKEFLKYIGIDFSIADPLEEGAEAADDLNNELENVGQSLEEIAKQNKQFLQNVGDITKEYRKQNAEALQSLDFQMRSLHMSDQEIALEEQKINLQKQLADTLDKLNQKRREAQEDPSKGAGVVAAIDAEIVAVKRSAEATMEASKIKTQAYQTEMNMIEMRKKMLDESIAAAQNQLTIQQLEDQVQLIGLYGDELQEQTQYLQVIHDLQNTIQGYVEELLRLEQLRKENRIGEAEYQREVNHLQNMITLSAEYANARIEAEQKILDAQKATQENAALGAKQAMDSIAEQFKPYNMAQEAIKKGWDSISNAVDTFVETGKFKFSDFARSVIQDLAKMIAKAMIFKAISTALGAFGIKIPGLAEGGPVKGGSPYIVGEKGPELFVPQGSGKIVPNNQLQGGDGRSMNASAGPITNNYNTYNINALDAKSVAQLFAENRKAIFGANKMAEREMSYAGVR